MPENDSALEQGLTANWTSARPDLVLSRSLAHERPVRHLAFSPDGRRLASTDTYSRQGRLWDLATGRLLHILPHPGADVTSIAFAPKGALLATGTGIDLAGTPACVQLWDPDTGRPIGQPLRHEGRVVSMAFSPDARFLATVATPSYRGKLWECATGKPVGSGWSAPGVLRIAYFPDNKTVLTGGYAWHAARRDALSGEYVGTPLETYCDTLSIAVAPDGMTYLVGCFDQRVRHVDAATGKLLRQSDLLPGSVSAVAYSPDGLRSSPAPPTAWRGLWDLATFRPIASTAAHPGSVSAVGFAPDGKRIATSAGDLSLRVWELEPRQPFGVPFGPKNPAKVNFLTVSPDGRIVVCQSGSDRIQAIDGASGRPIGQPAQGCWWFQPVAGADSETFLLQPKRGSLRLWRPKRGQFHLAPIPYHREDPKPQPAALSPDGRRVATVESVWGETARLWNRPRATPSARCSYTPERCSPSQ